MSNVFDRIVNIAGGRLKMRHRESENGSIFQTALVFVRMNKPTIGRYKMKVSSKAIVNGEFEDKYGKRGSQFSPSGMPLIRFLLRLKMRQKEQNRLPWCWKTKMPFQHPASYGRIG